MKRTEKITVVLTLRERAHLKRVQQQLAASGCRASMSAIVLAALRQAIPQISE